MTSHQAPEAATTTRTRRRLRPLLATGAVLALLTAVPLALLGAIDGGMLDGLIERRLSAAIGRPMRFGQVRTHLLSRHPVVMLRDVRIAGSPGYGRDDLATIRRMDAELAPAALLAGRVAFRSLDLDGVVLHLVRLGPGRNNWTSARHRQGGPAFAPLASVAHLRIAGGSLRFQDLSRQLDVTGPFRLEDAAAAFHLQVRGLYRGAPIVAAMRGGRLNADAVGPPYPFAIGLADGRTRLAIHGRSVEPFDFSGYDVAVRGSGPNLADLGYLFDLVTPNSPPFTLSVGAHASKGHLRFDHLDIATGSSHITGAIWSDHANARRDLLGRLHATRLDRSDINALLAQVPSRAVARNMSGAVSQGAPGRFIISEAPLGLARLRATDLDFRVSADRITGYALPLRQLRTRVDLDHGLLDVPRFEAALFGGTVSGDFRIDARHATPRIAIHTTAASLRIAQIGAGTAGSSGRIDGRLALSGAGRSLHEAAAAATGGGEVRITDAALPSQAAWLLGGDLLRAVVAGGGGKGSNLTASITAGPFRGSDGRIATGNVAVATARGTATGTAAIDFAAEHLCVTLLGHADRARLFQVGAPARIDGPWLKPSVTVLPGRKAQALGLRGKLGLLLTPVAALLPLKGRPPEACR